MLGLRDAPNLEKNILWVTWAWSLCPMGSSGRRTRSPWTYWSTSRPRRAKASSQSRSTALSGPRQLIEQIANSLHKPGDEQVFVEADQLAREVENAMRNAP